MGVTEQLGSWVRAVKYGLSDRKREARSITREEFMQRRRERPVITELATSSVTTPFNKQKVVVFRTGLSRFNPLLLFKNIRFRRFLPFIGYHHILMGICVGAMVAISLLLGGCRPDYPMLTSIYLASMHDTSNSSTSSEASAVSVRIGYFSVCVSVVESEWTCSTHISTLEAITGNSSTASTMLQVAFNLKDRVFFPWFQIVAIVSCFLAFCLLSTFPGWHHESDTYTGSEVEVKPFPSRPVSYVALGFIALGALFSLVSSLWQHVGSVSLAPLVQPFLNETFKAQVGLVATVLTWLAFGLISLVAIGLITMITAIRTLLIESDY